MKEIFAYVLKTVKIIFHKIFLYLCLSFILGVTLNFLREQGTLFSVIMRVGLILTFGCFLIKEFYQKQKIKLSLFNLQSKSSAVPAQQRAERTVLFLIIVALMIFSSAAGGMRYNSVANPSISQTDLSYFNDYPQEIKLIGTVKRVEQRVENNRLVIDAESIEIRNEKISLNGRVMIFISRLVDINYGDQIILKGRLETPRPINGFNWPKHLANEGVLSVMFNPWVTLKEENQGNIIMSKIYSFNSFLQEKINQFLPYPESTILSAMLLGNKGEIPETISYNFRQTGLAHILAISGLHITIIAAIFFGLALSLGLWRKHAFILTSFFLLFFILMIGAPPSAIRAGIMGFLFLLSQYFGRNYSFLNATIFAATSILVFNPLSLFYDISFQFSFASILSIALLVPIFQHFTYKKLKIKTEKRRILCFFINIFLISVAILLFLGPLMAYYFGNLPVISPIVNLLAIPILPFILFFGIIFLLIALILPPLSLIFSGIIYLLISFLILLSNFFANIPIIEFFQIENISIYWLVIYYIVFLTAIYKIKKTIQPFLLLKI